MKPEQGVAYPGGVMYRFLLFICLLCLGTATIEAQPTNPPGTAGECPFFPPSRLKRLAACERATIEAYRTAGSHNPKWDADAETALKIYARLLCFDQAVLGTTNYQIMLGAFRKALTAGCDDPLVLSALLRLYQRDENLSERPAPELARAMVSRLPSHPYPARVQASIYLRAAAAVLSKSTDPAPARTWLDSGLGQLVQAIGEGAEREDLYDLALQWYTLYRRATGEYKTASDLFQSRVAERSLTNVVSRVISASFLLDWATEASQSPAAKAQPKPDRSWVVQVDDAQQLLEEAWLQDPTDIFICKQMLISLGFELNVESQVNDWFERGRKLNPDYYGLYASKLRYYMSGRRPDRRKAIAFGRECLATANWREQIPFLLVDAHLKFASTNYFQQPEVWQDIQTVHETYLQRFPGNNVVRSSYAYCACLARRWDLAGRLLGEMGDLAVPSVFRGDYRKCLADIQEHTVKPGAVNAKP